MTAAQRPADEVLGDEARGDVGMHGFWKRERTAIFDIQVCDTDAKSYGNRNLNVCGRRGIKLARLGYKRRRPTSMD